VRRLRSTLWLLQPLRARRLTGIRARAQRVGRALGAVRDIDELLQRVGRNQPIASVLERQRSSAVRTMRVSLQRDAVRRWPGELSAPLPPRGQRRDSIERADAAAVAAALLEKRRKRMMKHVRRLAEDAPLEEFHAARRRAKQLGDALDDFEPQLGAAGEPLRRDVKRLRATLGQLQDAAVAEAELTRLVRHFAGQPSARDRLQRLVASCRKDRVKALRRSLRAVSAMRPRHWRRIREALPKPAALPSGP
jgi:CHAD domain-containing protein